MSFHFVDLSAERKILFTNVFQFTLHANEASATGLARMLLKYLFPPTLTSKLSDIISSFSDCWLDYSSPKRQFMFSFENYLGISAVSGFWTF